VDVGSGRRRETRVGEGVRQRRPISAQSGRELSASGGEQGWDLLESVQSRREMVAVAAVVLIGHCESGKADQDEQACGRETGDESLLKSLHRVGYLRGSIYFLSKESGNRNRRESMGAYIANPGLGQFEDTKTSLYFNEARWSKAVLRRKKRVR